MVKISQEGIAAVNLRLNLHFSHFEALRIGPSDQ